MKCDEERTRDWQEQVWRVKEELAAEAKKMGMREYLAYVEKEADRILEVRAKASLFLARDRPPTKPARPRSRKR
jgi:L-rhamnose mutarotase